MNTSVKVTDFVAMQGQMAAQKFGNDYKNDAFYSFMQQTANSQKTNESNSAKKESSTTETDSSVDKTEENTKPETEEREEETTQEGESTKKSMLQQLDLALLAATVQTNVTQNQNVQTAQTNTQLADVQGENMLPQTNENVVEQVSQPTSNAEQNVEVKTAQTTSEEVNLKQEVPKEVTKEASKEVVKEVSKEVVSTTDAQTKQQSEGVKTVAAEQSPEEIATVTKETTQQNNTQENTSSNEEMPKDTATTAKKEFSDDVVTVKVGDNAQINDTEMAQKLADKMMTKFSQHENEFEIQLTPKELGKITIKLVMENGQAHISMFAENGKTLSLLAEKAREIGAMIQQNTGNQTNVEVIDQKTMENQNQNKEQKGDGFTRQQEEQQRQHQQKLKEEQSRDFIQQMRLGLWNVIE